MTNRRFPVAGTELTVPWEVATDACVKRANAMWELDQVVALTPEQFAAIGGMDEEQLDKWYGKHWREVAQ